MGFDTIVSNAGRLEILSALAVQDTQDFVTLRQRTRLTDGNLSSHARRLQSAGLVQIDKVFRDGKPVTSFHLTSDGRKALEGHVRRLMAALSQRRTATTAEQRQDIPPLRSSIAPAQLLTAAVAGAQEEWVD